MSRKKPLAVFAFGGNAILPAHSEGTQEEQEYNAARSARYMADIIGRGYGLIVVHGNGPQVGNELLRAEESETKLPPVTLDYCVAKTKGEMGYLLEKALRNELIRRGRRPRVATVLTTVLVDARDPAFKKPTKPIGPYYTRYRARHLKEEKKWPMVEISDHGFRRVVASPKPVKIIDIDIVRRLIGADYAVIAGGGGGVPAVGTRSGKIRGVEAVIDKDYTAALFANELGAKWLVIFTEVAQVALNFGTPKQKNLLRITLSQARRYLKEGHFPPGSMGPKIEAAISFAEKRKKRFVLITSAGAWCKTLKGKSGTRIVN